MLIEFNIQVAIILFILTNMKNNIPKNITKEFHWYYTRTGCDKRRFQ